MDSLAQGAERRFNGFVTRTTKRITVHGAKLAEKFLRIALCPVYWDRTGRAPSRNSKPSSAANPRAFFRMHGWHRWAASRKHGRPLAAMDMLVAAHALATGLTLVT